MRACRKNGPIFFSLSVRQQRWYRRRRVGRQASVVQKARRVLCKSQGSPRAFFFGTAGTRSVATDYGKEDGSLACPFPRLPVLESLCVMGGMAGKFFFPSGDGQVN